MLVAEMVCKLLSTSAAVTMAAAIAIFGVCGRAEAQTQVASRIDSVPSAHPLASALKTARGAMKSLEGVSDYQARFVKTEIIGGTLVEQQMHIRFREQPMSVHLKFIEPHAGREVAYVEGRNDNKLLVKDSGLISLIGPLSLDPTSAMAMKETVYPITAIGLRNMLDRLIEHWLDEISTDDIKVTLYPNARIGDCACEVVEATHTRQSPQTEYHKLRLYVDKQSGLPIRVQQLGFPAQPGGKPPVIADYLYLGLQTNPGLADRDFVVGQ